MTSSIDQEEASSIPIDRPDGEDGLRDDGEDKVGVRILEAGDEVKKTAEPRGLRGRRG